MKRIKTRRKHFRITNPLGFSLFCAIIVLAIGLVVGIVCLAVGYGEDAVKWAKAQLNGTKVVAEITQAPTQAPTATAVPTDSAVETPDIGTPVPETPTPQPIEIGTPEPVETTSPNEDPNAPLYGFTIGLDPARDGESKYKKECAYNLEFAQQLAAYLESKGATVIVTRENNTKSVGNSKRAKAIKSADCDVALRLICNHISSKSTGCYAQANKKYKDFATSLIAAYSEATGIRLQAGKTNGFESKTDAVAKDCGCPCVMIVLGNWENKSDRGILEDEAGREKMIAAIYESLLRELKK